MRRQGPPAFILFEDVGDVVIAVHLRNVRPRPHELDGRCGRRVGDRRDGRREPAHDDVAVEGTSEASLGRRRLLQRFEGDEPEVRCVGAQGDDVVVLVRGGPGDADRLVLERLERGAAGGDRAGDRRRRPRDPPALPHTLHERRAPLFFPRIALIEFLGQACRLGFDFLEALLLRRCRHEDERLVRAVEVRVLRIEPRLLDRVEERVEGEEVLLRDRVELVIMATSAPHGQPEEDGARRRDPVHGVLDQVLLRDRAPFVSRHVVPVEPAGDLLRHLRVGEQVPRELLRHELVERHVRPVRIQHPVAPQPHLTPRVHVDPAGVRVARLIQPRRRQALRAPREVRLLRRQLVDPPLVRVRALVGEEGVHLLGRRREARDIQERAPDQRGAVRVRRRLDVLGLEARQHEPVDRVPRPRLVLDGRWRRAHRRDERPVRLVDRAFGDPTPEQLTLLRRERRLVAVRRGHRHRWVARGDPADQLALIRVPRDNRGPVLPRHHGGVAQIKPQVGMARRRIRAVALEAPVRQDRADVAREANGRGRHTCPWFAPRGRRGGALLRPE